MKRCLFWLMVIIMVAGCKLNDKVAASEETITNGSINISVDESFKPVIDQQIKVFESSFPNAHIYAEYKTEAGCLRDLEKDSTRLIIISRDLNQKEEDYYKAKLEFKPDFGRLASDAIAIVINEKNPDSVFTINDLQQLLLGKSGTNKQVIVDGKGLTSTIRFLIDSILKGVALGKNVTAAKNSEELINYIATSSNAIGFVGISWFSQWQQQNSYKANAIRTGLVECKNCDKDVYAKPSQQTIMFKQYPLVRGLYYIVKENYAGVGSGFTNFLSLERGQLIFSRAGLVPYKMQFNRRRSQIKETE